MKKKQKRDTTIQKVDKLHFQFNRTNKFVKRVVAHNTTLLFSLLVYLFFSAAIVLFFMFVYHVFDCNCSFWQSGAVYFGTGMTDAIKKHRFIVMAEVACRDLFSIYVVGISISNILVPQNPLELSELAVFKNNQLEIRYWVMLPLHQFLHDASIRILVSKERPIGKDSGRLVEKDKSKKYEYVENLQLIRGVRRVVLPKKPAYRFMKKLCSKEENWELMVIITGRLSNGKQYYVYKTYDKSTIHKGYSYVSTDTVTLPSDLFCGPQIKKLKLPSNDYMHYNLVYRKQDDEISLIYADNNRKQYEYILQCKKYYKTEILMKEFGGINGKINYILNYFAVFYLNNSGILSRILRKII